MGVDNNYYSLVIDINTGCNHYRPPPKALDDCLAIVCVCAVLLSLSGDPRLGMTVADIIMMAVENAFHDNNRFNVHIVCSSLLKQSATLPHPSIHPSIPPSDPPHPENVCELIHYVVIHFPLNNCNKPSISCPIPCPWTFGNYKSTLIHSFNQRERTTLCNWNDIPNG